MNNAHRIKLLFLAWFWGNLGGLFLHCESEPPYWRGWYNRIALDFLARAWGYEERAAGRLPPEMQEFPDDPTGR